MKREAEEDWGQGQMAPLILKRAPIGDNQDDYDVLENGVAARGVSRHYGRSLQWRLDSSSGSRSAERIVFLAG